MSSGYCFQIPTVMQKHIVKVHLVLFLILGLKIKILPILTSNYCEFSLSLHFLNCEIKKHELFSCPISNDHYKYVLKSDTESKDAMRRFSPTAFSNHWLNIIP